MATTPDGQPQKVPVDPTSITQCWVQPSDFPDIQADATKSLILNSMIIAACAAVNRMCSRKFNQQQIDTIIKDQGIFYRDYKTFDVKNSPIVSLDNAWLQVINTFAVLDLTYLQVDVSSNWIKILPTFSVYVQSTLPFWALTPSTNVWLRATTGYAVDYSNPASPINDVPSSVIMATQFYVRYLYGVMNLPAGVKSYSTQTYSQTNSTAADDPLLSTVKDMLSPYYLYWAVA